VPRRPLLVLVLLALLVAVPAAAHAKDGRPEQRIGISCGGGVRAELRLRTQDGRIRTRFAVDDGRAGRWNIVLVHEHRIAWRGRASGSFEIERSLPDYPGNDAVTARATGPRGVVCQATGLAPELSDAESVGQGNDG
jgi:hypothetical protein